MAFAYAVMIAGVICFQIALILGAPWGRYTQGGSHSGPLPNSGRAIAGLSIVLLLAMAGGVLSSSGHPPGWPRWTGWVSVVVTGVSMVLNWITPSRGERLVWAPIMTIMFVMAVWVVGAS